MVRTQRWGNENQSTATIDDKGDDRIHRDDYYEWSYDNSAILEVCFELFHGSKKSISAAAAASASTTTSFVADILSCCCCFCRRCGVYELLPVSFQIQWRGL